MLITCWRLQLHMRLHVRRDGRMLGARHLARPRHALLPRRMLSMCWHVLRLGRLRRSAGWQAACWLLRCCKTAAREERRARPLGRLRLMRRHRRPLRSRQRRLLLAWGPWNGGLRCRPLAWMKCLLRLRWGARACREQGLRLRRGPQARRGASGGPRACWEQRLRRPVRLHLTWSRHKAMSMSGMHQPDSSRL